MVGKRWVIDRVRLTLFKLSEVCVHDIIRNRIVGRW